LPASFIHFVNPLYGPYRQQFHDGGLNRNNAPLVIQTELLAVFRINLSAGHVQINCRITAPES
jgi:hypothetical protein